MQLVDLSKVPYYKGLHYGLPGAGKTYLAGSAAFDDRMSPVLHLDMGGNPNSIRRNEQKPDIIRIDKPEECNAIYDFLTLPIAQRQTHQFVTKMGLSAEYKTLVLDGVTDVQRAAFNTVLGHPNIKPADLPGRRERQHYGSVLAMMTNFAYLFYKLPMHVIITALEHEDIDQATSARYYKPLLSGQSSTEVGGYALTIGRVRAYATLGAKDVEKIPPKDRAGAKSVISFVGNGSQAGKDQYNMNVEFIVNPTMTKILDLIAATQ